MTIRAVGERLVCTVEDDGEGISAGFESRVGLANVRSRLELMYPSLHVFEIGPRATGGTRIEIDVPLTRHA